MRNNFRLRGIMLTGCVGIVMMLAPYPAGAHHSFAIFDQARVVTTKAVVNKIEWTNPHAYIFLDAADEQGHPATLAIECGSISLLSRKGWKVNSLRVGDAVSITYHPLRSGKMGGMLVSVELPGGVVLRG
jgi:hypothetical protein